MANEQGNQFAQAADAAAQVMKQRMGLPSKPVSEAVQKPPPPPGSYVSQQRAQVQEPPPPPPEEQAEPQPQEEPLSSRAQERIRELANQRRELERQAAEAQALAQQREQELSQLRERYTATETRFNEFLEQNLDALDPETRAEVMSRVQAQQAAATMREEVSREIAPLLQRVHEMAFENDVLKVAAKYPAFDADNHMERMRQFLERNQQATVEQAFRAIATDEELGAHQQTGGQRAPTVVQPRGTNPTQRYAQQTDTEDQKHTKRIQERAEWVKLARSGRPEDQRRVREMINDDLAKTLFGS